jgi:hypothetical protein
VSLIDEALKRAQEAGKEQDGASRQRPWVPTPLPDPAIARRRKLRRGLLLAVAVAAVAGAALWMSRVLTAPGTRPASRAPIDAQPATPVPQPTLIAVEVPPPAKNLRPTRAPRPTLPVAAGETATGEPAAVESEAPPASARGRTFSKSVTLPDGTKIELGGIVWSETDPRALVNDRIMAVGGYVEGYTLAKIEEDRITLEKDGETLVVLVK